MSLFTYGVMGQGKQNHKIIPLAWCVIDIVFEVGQVSDTSHLLAAGHFEWVDIFAILSATALSILLLRPKTNKSKAHKESQKLAITLSLLTGSATMLGSYLPTDCEYPDGTIESCDVKYIYLSDNQLRRADRIYFSNENANEKTRELINDGYSIKEFHGIKTPGKIALYHNMLFVNDWFLGTHIFDNSNPKQPVFLGYVQIIGNQDIAIHQGILYLDSFMDIVAIDLSAFAVDNPLPIKAYRNRDILLKQDPEYMLPDLVSALYDPAKGVAIGYEREDGERYYFWDLGL